MKEKLFSEKDSLELISQMLKQTRQNLEVGSGNIFLYYGYAALAISLLVFVLIFLTGNPVWAALWFVMFIVSFVIQRKAEKNKPHVVTYMDKAISNTWSVLSVLFLLTVLAIVALGWYMGHFEFVLMLPLSLLYAGIGSSITGVIINMRALIYTPLVAFIVGVYMLVELLAGSEPTAYWHLYFGMSFVLMMIIPGHLINSKSIQQC